MIIAISIFDCSKGKKNSASHNKNSLVYNDLSSITVGGSSAGFRIGIYFWFSQLISAIFTKMDSNMDSKMDSKMNSKMDSKMVFMMKKNFNFLIPYIILMIKFYH